MRFLLVLLFAFTFPVVLFLTTILYGGVSPVALKNELARANIYSKVTDYLSSAPTDDESDNPELDGILSEFFTPDYTQTKVEETIDKSYIWVTGETEVIPAVAFPEIKQKLTASHPELLTELESMAESTDQPMDTTGMTDEEIAQAQQMNEQMQEQMAMFSTFAKNDFSLPLDTYLKGVKQMYSTIKLLHPILVVVMLLELLLLVFLCKTWPSRLKWIGSALLFSGIVGFGAIAFQSGIVLLTDFALSQGGPNEVLLLVMPILTEIMRSFVKTYTTYQGIASVVLLILSAVCFVIASLQKTTPTKKPALKPVTVKKAKK